MCGIAGAISLDGSPIQSGFLPGMLELMTHRGPDDYGYMTDGPSCIGVRRLSIIDVAGGQQPLSDESGRIHLVFNGEIYNHVELREELAAEGHTFNTGSDGEVIVHLYELYGIDAIQRLNGMFAFALYDAEARALWLARDRLGIKPLHYTAHGKYFAFASDARALLPFSEGELKPERVIEYLTLGYVPDNQSVWGGVTKVPPGHQIWVQGNQVVVTPYWKVPTAPSWVGTADEAGDTLASLLEDSIRLQMRSDVPVGIFLSGGVDSSALVALASRITPQPLRTFSVNFQGKASEDAGYARLVAARYGAQHVELNMDLDDNLTALDLLIPHLDEPIGDSAILAALLLSQEARQRGVIVLLNGAGGDELFGGYARHKGGSFGTPTWAADRLPLPMRRSLAMLLKPLSEDHASIISDPRYAWAAGVSGARIPFLRRLFRSPLAVAHAQNTIEQEFSPLVEPLNGQAFSLRRMSLDVSTYLPNNVLALTDKATMAVSVEGRVPLLDHRLVEFAHSLPEDINLLGGDPKGLFKAVLKEIGIPSPVLDRPKEGFNAPDEAWLKSPGGRQSLVDMTRNPSPIVEDLIDMAFIGDLARESNRIGRSSSVLFGLVMFNRWHNAID